MVTHIGIEFPSQQDEFVVQKSSVLLNYRTPQEGKRDDSSLYNSVKTLGYISCNAFGQKFEKRWVDRIESWLSRGNS